MRAAQTMGQCGIGEEHRVVSVPTLRVKNRNHASCVELKERLSVARQRIEALLAQLTNPKP